MRLVSIKRFHSAALLIPALCLVLVAAPSAFAQTPIGEPPLWLPGDVNGDGVINILDIQAAISQALGFAAETAEADVTGTGSVNILDVQNLINTVLGAGGLVQTVTAEVPPLTTKSDGDAPAQRVIAVSNEGLFAEGLVDPETGMVELELRVNTGWSLALLVEAEEGAEVLVGTVQFPIADTLSSTLPLPTLSIDRDLNLGLLPFNSPAVVGEDVRTLLADIVPPIDARDTTGDGVPDFIAPLLDYLEGLQAIEQQGNAAGLRAAIADCVAGLVPDEIPPSLEDSNGNGVPDIFESLVACIQVNVSTWLEGRGVPPIAVPGLVGDVMDAIVAQLPDYMSGLDSPLLADENGNGIPDVIEDHLSLLGVPTVMDNAGNGIPNFAELTDNNIPLILDPEGRICGVDTDGDGIPDAFDIDHNNNGIPNYADPEFPCVP